MTSLCVLSFFVGCLLFADAAEKLQSKPLPSYITACKRANPDAGDCSKNSANAAIQFLLKGDNEYKIPSLLPLKLPKMEMKSGDNFQLTLTDISVMGLDGLVVDKMKIDTEAKHVELTVVSKWLCVDSQYTINGHILVLPISGSGASNLTFYDNTFKYTLDYETYKRSDGKEYFKIVKSGTDINIPRAYFHLENLFNGNKQLGDHMNNFLNENSGEVVKDLGYPVIAELIQVIVTQVFEAIIRVVPYDEIFPL